MVNQDQLLQVIEVLQNPPFKRTKERLQILKELTQYIPFFQDYISRGNKLVHEECCMNMKYRFCEENEIVFSQGEMGDRFYLILSGSVRVLVEGEEEKPTIQGMKCVKILKSGTGFGEIALIKSQPRLATIQCETQCHLATLDKASFSKILKRFEEDKLLKEINLYQRIPLFSKWGQKQLRIIYLNSFRVILKKGEYLFKEGEEPKSMNIICSGEFTAHKIVEREKDEAQIEREIDKNGIFRVKVQRNIPSMKLQLAVWQAYEICGQEALIKNSSHEYSVQCSSTQGEVIIIKKYDFNSKIMVEETSMKNVIQSMEMREIWLQKKIFQIQKIMKDNEFGQQIHNQKSHIQQIQNKLIGTSPNSQIQYDLKKNENQLLQFSHSFYLMQEQQNHISGTQENQILFLKDKYLKTDDDQILTLKKQTPQVSERNVEQRQKTKKFKDVKIRSTLNLKVNITQTEQQEQVTPCLIKSSLNYQEHQNLLPKDSDSYLSSILSKQSISDKIFNLKQQKQKNSQSPKKNEFEISSRNIQSAFKIEGKRKIRNYDLIISKLQSQQKNIYNIQNENKLEEESSIIKSLKHSYTRHKSMENLPSDQERQCCYPENNEQLTSNIKQRELKHNSLTNIHLLKESFSNQKLQKSSGLQKTNSLTYQNEGNEIQSSLLLLLKPKQLNPNKNELKSSHKQCKKLSIIDYNAQSRKNFQTNSKNVIRNHILKISKKLQNNKKMDECFTQTQIQETQKSKQQINLQNFDCQSPLNDRSNNTKIEKQLDDFLCNKNQNQRKQEFLQEDVEENISKREKRKNCSCDLQFSTPTTSQKQIIKSHESHSPFQRGPIIKCKTTMSKERELYKFEREKSNSLSKNKGDTLNKLIHNIYQEVEDFDQRSFEKIKTDELDLEDDNFFLQSCYDNSNKNGKQLQITKFFSKGISLKTLERQSTPNSYKTPKHKYKQSFNQSSEKSNNHQIMNYFLTNANNISITSFNNMQSAIVDNNTKTFFNNKSEKDSSQHKNSQRSYIHSQNSIYSKNDLQTENTQKNFKLSENETFFNFDINNTSTPLNSSRKEHHNLKMNHLPLNKNHETLGEYQFYRGSKNLENKNINSNNQKSSDSMSKMSSTQCQTQDNFSDFRQFLVQGKLQQNLPQNRDENNKNQKNNQFKNQY